MKCREEQLDVLEKRYNVEFIIKNERLKKYSFTGTFTHQRLERIMGILNEMVDEWDENDP